MSSTTRIGWKYLPLILSLTVAVSIASRDAFGFTLWATKYSYLGSGRFFGPGTNTQDQPMFELVVRNLAFISPVDFVTPFFNNGPAVPNICAEHASTTPADGRLSNGLLINEHVDTCPLTIAGTKLLPAVVYGGPHRGQQVAVALADGNVVMTMDFALDLNIGEKGVIRVPFYGTTGTVTVPFSIQTQQGKNGVDQAGAYVSGTAIKGRVGDFNGDGWIDGTLVAAGVLPPNSIFYPGQPFAIQMNFETDIPIEGVIAGNTRLLHAPSKTQ